MSDKAILSLLGGPLWVKKVAQPSRSIGEAIDACHLGGGKSKIKKVYEDMRSDLRMAVFLHLCDSKKTIMIPKLPTPMQRGE